MSGLLDAEEACCQRKRSLGEILNLPPDEAERLELRGTIWRPRAAPAALHELVQLALDCRPDVVAYRLGSSQQRPMCRLQRANRFSDAYLLYQPYTYQEQCPLSASRAATSWAVGITVPLPVYNRNQGNIERAKINVDQTRGAIGTINSGASIPRCSRRLSEYQ